MAKPVPFDDSLAISRGQVRLTRAGDPISGYWHTGDYIYPGGLVGIYRQDAGPRDQAITRLDYVAHGRLHMRTFHHAYTDRGLGRVCRKFISDVELAAFLKGLAEARDARLAEGAPGNG